MHMSEEVGGEVLMLKTYDYVCVQIQAISHESGAQAATQQADQGRTPTYRGAVPAA